MPDKRRTHLMDYKKSDVNIRVVAMFGFGYLLIQEGRWQNRQLLVQNWSLDEVLAELGRFHAAFMLYDAAELKSIKVSATLPLDRPEQALALLASSFPEIRVRHYSSWLVKIDRTHPASK